MITEIDNCNKTINCDYFAIIIVSFDNNKQVDYNKNDYNKPV